jgi:hypothetical protein
MTGKNNNNKRKKTSRNVQRSSRLVSDKEMDRY